MIRAIISDFGGVIGQDIDSVIEDAYVENGLSRNLAASAWEKHWPLLKIGAETVEEYWSAVAATIGDKGIAKRIRENATSRMDIHAPVLDYISSLRRQGYTVVILSNESIEWMGIYRERGKLDEAFDKVYVSGELRMAKPQKEIFTHVLREEKLAPDEAVFIDDREHNTRAAEVLGIKAVLYTDLASLKRALAEILQR